MKHLILAILIFISSIASATEPPHPYIQDAELYYAKGAYDQAIQHLLATPGVANLAPALTPMNDDSRAKIFYDLGCCYLAAGDSLRADQAFRYAFSLNDALDQGHFKQADAGTFWWALLRNKEAARRLKSRRLFAAMRSIVVPGWGQFYRGHTKKGYAFLGAAIVTAGVIGLQYHGYRRNRQSYYQTDSNLHLAQRYANDDGTRYTEWEHRYRVAHSNMKNLNILLGILGSIWLLNVADSAIFKPAPMGVSISF